MRRLGLLLAGRPGQRAAPVVGLPAAEWGSGWPGSRRRWTSRPAGARCSRGAPWFPPVMAATESWPPNLAKATALLHPRGRGRGAGRGRAAAAVRRRGLRPGHQRAPGQGGVVGRDRPGAAAGRHVLLPARRPGQRRGAGRVLARPAACRGARGRRIPTGPAAGAAAAGLDVVGTCGPSGWRMEFHDVGAVVYFLRKVIWMVPGFSVEAVSRPARRTRRPHPRGTAVVRRALDSTPHRGSPRLPQWRTGRVGCADTWTHVGPASGRVRVVGITLHEGPGDYDLCPVCFWRTRVNNCDGRCWRMGRTASV